MEVILINSLLKSPVPPRWEFSLDPTVLAHQVRKNAQFSVRVAVPMSVERENLKFSAELYAVRANESLETVGPLNVNLMGEIPPVQVCTSVRDTSTRPPDHNLGDDYYNLKLRINVLSWQLGKAIFYIKLRAGVDLSVERRCWSAMMGPFLCFSKIATDGFSNVSSNVPETAPRGVKRLGAIVDQQLKRSRDNIACDNIACDNITRDNGGENGDTDCSDGDYSECEVELRGGAIDDNDTGAASATKAAPKKSRGRKRGGKSKSVTTKESDGATTKERVRAMIPSAAAPAISALPSSYDVSDPLVNTPQQFASGAHSHFAEPAHPHFAAPAHSNFAESHSMSFAENQLELPECPSSVGGGGGSPQAGFEDMPIVLVDTRTYDQLNRMEASVQNTIESIAESNKRQLQHTTNLMESLADLSISTEGLQRELAKYGSSASVEKCVEQLAHAVTDMDTKFSGVERENKSMQASIGSLRDSMESVGKTVNSLETTVQTLIAHHRSVLSAIGKRHAEWGESLERAAGGL